MGRRGDEGVVVAVAVAVTFELFKRGVVPSEEESELE